MTASTDPGVRTALGATSRAQALRAAPLADWSARFAAASDADGRFAIREVPFATQVNLRGNPADAAFVKRARAAFGCDLPTAANTWNAGGASSVLWLGPDEWLVVASDGVDEAMEAKLRSGLEGLHFSVVDQSANRTIIEVAGAEARILLAKGCPLDLHRNAFGPPQVAQTLLAKSQVILQCLDERRAFRLFVRLSFAAYLSEWLLDAAAELAAARGIDSARLASRLA